MFKFLLDIIFPRECLGCGCERTWLCQQCFNKIQLNKKEFNDFESQLDRIWIAADYGNQTVARAIKYLKYDYLEELAEPLGNLIADYIKVNSLLAGLENLIITAVPLNKKRLLERDFNQSALIARQAAKVLNIEMDAGLLKRIRNTPSQTKLNRQERQENVKNAFALNDKNVKGKNIIIIDDVITTGSTLNECAQILRDAGANKIIGCVVARN